MQTDQDSEDFEVHNCPNYRKLYPRAYDDGFNRGYRYYDDCIPVERHSYKCKYTEYWERHAFKMGVAEGYIDAKKTDYRINDFPIDNGEN